MGRYLHVSVIFSSTLLLGLTAYYFSKLPADTEKDTLLLFISIAPSLMSLLYSGFNELSKKAQREKWQELLTNYIDPIWGFLDLLGTNVAEVSSINEEVRQRLHATVNTLEKTPHCNCPLNGQAHLLEDAHASENSTQRAAERAQGIPKVLECVRDKFREMHNLMSNGH